MANTYYYSTVAIYDLPMLKARKLEDIPIAAIENLTLPVRKVAKTLAATRWFPIYSQFDQNFTTSYNRMIIPMGDA